MMTSATPSRTRYPYSPLPLLALLAATLVWPHHVFGVGSRIPNQDPEAIARGNAFVATADNPSAMYYNPAGITQLEGQNIQAGSLFYLKVDADYESPAGQRTENKRDIIAVPHLDYTISLKDLPLSFGLGVYSPFGLEMEWPDDAPFRNAGLKASLTYITLNPVIAWRPLPTLSLAIGPTFNYSEAKLRQGVVVSPYQLRVDGEAVSTRASYGSLTRCGLSAPSISARPRSTTAALPPSAHQPHSSRRQPIRQPILSSHRSSPRASLSDPTLIGT